MKTFQERIEALRNELIGSITDILKTNGLQRLELSEKLENPTYVVWHEPQESVLYDTPVYALNWLAGLLEDILKTIKIQQNSEKTA